MTNRILILNCGSSSIKFALYAAQETPKRLLRGAIEGLGAAPRFHAADERGTALPPAAMKDRNGDTLTLDSAPHWLLEWLAAGGHDHEIAGAGHRVVHGGAQFTGPARIDDRVLDALERLDPMAPLHQPHNLATIRALRALRPSLAQVACFDTAFHAAQPDVARRYALPRTLTAQGVRSYGFHGLSYEYIASLLPGLLGERAEGRVVVAHLGNGASLCALNRRRSIATTMGFTALDGLVMGTRSGAIDPGVIFYLMREKAMSAQAVEDLLYHRCGLLGVSEMSSDMRVLLGSDDPRAREAVELFVYRAARELGSLAAALGGLDALIFTAGIGEHAAPVRAMICEAARWLGIALDPDANTRHARTISAPGSAVVVLVVQTDEERIMVEHTRRVLEL